MNAWWQPPTVDALRELANAQLAACATHGKLGVVTIIRPQVIRVVDERTRAAAVATRKQLAATFLSDACLIPDPGFMAAAVRSVLAGINALSRAPVRQHVFSDARSAAEYTHRHLAVEHRMSSAEVVATTEYLLHVAR